MQRQREGKLRYNDNYKWTKMNKEMLPKKTTSIQTVVYSLLIRKVRDNLTTCKRKALRSLQRKIIENEFVIKPADKGSVTVVMSFKDYVQEVERHLSNTKNYLPLDCDPTPTYTRGVNTLLLQMIEKIPLMNIRRSNFVPSAPVQHVFICFLRLINLAILNFP